MPAQRRTALIAPISTAASSVLSWAALRAVLIPVLCVNVLVCTVLWPDIGSPAPAPGAQPGTPGRAALEHAKSLIETHQEAAAIITLKKFLASSPRVDDLDDAYLLMAAAYISKKEPEEALTYLNQLLAEFPNSDLAGRARLMLGAAHIGMGNLDAGLSALIEVKSLPSSPETKRQAFRMIADLQAKKSDFFKAIQAWLDEMALTSEDQRPEIRERIRDVVLGKMDRKGLQGLRDAYPMAFPGDLALIRLIEIQSARGEEHLAERNIRTFLNRFPNHDYAPAASDILHSFKAKLKASQQILAAVLPLSGRLQQFGIESLNGIQLALEKAKESLGLPSIGLRVVDSVTDKAVLRMELSEVLNEYRPLAVIGPLLSRDLQLMAGLGEATGTPFVTPSATLPDVRRFGTHVFSTAMTPPLQAQRIADHALGRLGYRRFSILYPDTPYGQDLAHLFTLEVRKRGGELIAIESYKETDTDFGPQIRRIKEADLKRYGESSTTKTSKGGMRTIYTPGFDAIFVPGDPTQVALIAPQLLFYDVKVPLLGSSSWNSPDLLRLADRSIDGSIFVDGFFIDSPDQNIREFVTRYRRQYQADPSVFAALAYDAARIVLEAVRKGATTGPAVTEQLLQLHDLPTLAGPASFGSSGALNRRLFVIYVKNGKLVQLN